jgi:hypothetical protein
LQETIGNERKPSWKKETRNNNNNRARRRRKTRNGDTERLAQHITVHGDKCDLDI